MSIPASNKKNSVNGNVNTQGNPNTEEDLENDTDTPEENNEEVKPKTLTITQDDLNRLMKNEKEKGKRSILKELGVNNTSDAKSALEGYQAYLDSQKTELEKANENLTAANAKIAEAEARAIKAEYGLQAIAKFNAVPESVEDLVAIAVSKVTDEKDIEQVLKEMQENKAFSGFFNAASNSNNEEKPKGMGNPIGTGIKGAGGTGADNYGAMLARKNLSKSANINLNGGNK